MKELGVKEGDKVIFHGVWGDRRVAIVTRVTPTGRIRVDTSDRQYDKFGRELGGDVWQRTRLSAWSEEAEQEVKDEQTIKVALNICHELREMNIEQARWVIKEFLKGGK